MAVLTQSELKSIEYYNKACECSEIASRVKLLKNCLRLNSEFPEARYNLALCYLEIKSKEAVPELEKTLVILKRKQVSRDLWEGISRTYVTACLTVLTDGYGQIQLNLLPKDESLAKAVASLALGFYGPEKNSSLLNQELADQFTDRFDFTSVQLVLDINRLLGEAGSLWIEKYCEQLLGFFYKYPVSASRFLRRNLYRTKALQVIETVARSEQASLYQIIEYFHAAIDILPFEECEKILDRLVVAYQKFGGSLADQSVFTSLSFWYQQQDTDDRRVWDLVREKNRQIPKVPTNGNSRRQWSTPIKSIGFMSSDFRRHSVSYFILPLIRWLHAKGYEVVLFHGSSKKDDVTELFAKSGAKFIDCNGLGGGEAVSTIQSFDLDCVIDLNGWTSGTALHLLRNRLARIQGTYLGYGVSSGYDGVDFRITDSYVDPSSDSSSFYSEELLHLDSCFLNYSPLDLEVKKRTRKEFDIRKVAFCSTNHPRKFNAFLLNTWGKLLKALPGSSLTLKHNDFRDHHVVVRMKKYLIEGGAQDSQLIFIPRIEGRSHLDFYHDFDYLLDTFPYTGTTTTLESLWAGCPVLTMRGSVHRARVSASILSRLGLDHLIFEPIDFVSGVTDLLQVRHTSGIEPKVEFRELIASTPLGDIEHFGPEFIRVLNQYYRGENI